MHLITLDFETYYDREYSLSKLTTDAYIHDPRFLPIGVGVAIDNGSPEWVPFTTDDEFEQFLRSLDIPSNTLLCHNAMFDAAILAWKYRIYAGFYLDTLSMSRPIHGVTVGGSLAKLATHYNLGTKGTEVVDALGKYPQDFTPEELHAYGQYCRKDVALTRKLFRRLLRLLPPQELHLIDDTIRMYVSPRLQLDLGLLEEHLMEVRNEQKRVLDAAGVDVGDLRSSPKMAALLKQRGVIPPTKISPTTGKETLAFSKQDKEFTDLLEHDDPVVRALVAARLKVRSTLEETRTQRFIEVGQRMAAKTASARPLLPVPLAYAGAVTTWRWSGIQKMNLQNLPGGGKLRQAMCARSGELLVGGDLSNIEMRVNHWLAGRRESMDAYIQGRDLYVEFAAILFHKDEADVTPQERKVGKVAHLGLGYGCGSHKFQHMARMFGIPLTSKEAERIVTLWRDTYKEIPAFWREAERAIRTVFDSHNATYAFGDNDIVCADRIGGVVGYRFPNGAFVTYNDLRRDADNGWSYKGRHGRKRLYGGAAVENICQAVARHILAEQWVAFSKYLREHAPEWQVVLQVHDELVAAGPKEHAEAVADALLRSLQTPPSWWPNLHLGAKVYIGERFSDLKD